LEIIRSNDNKLLKHSRKLKIKKWRQENREFMIEGVRFLEEAVFAGTSIKYCLCSEDLGGDRIDSLIKEMLQRNIKVYLVEDNLMQDVCETKSPQGIVAVIEKREFNSDALFEESDFIVLIDRVQDPGNLGTIIRTADAAGAWGVIISDGSVDPYSPKVLRSTMGSIFHVPVIYDMDIVSAIGGLKTHGFTVYVSSLKGSTAYYNEIYRGKTAIVIGNEANGVDSKIVQTADRLIKIPMPGKAESLNAAVAGSILMFEVVKQRSNIDNQV